MVIGPPCVRSRDLLTHRGHCYYNSHSEASIEQVPALVIDAADLRPDPGHGSRRNTDEIPLYTNKVRAGFGHRDRESEREKTLAGSRRTVGA